MSLPRFLPFLILPFTTLACKVDYSFTGADVPAEAETISIDRFPNNAGLGPPNLGQVFTEDLRDLFMRQTSLELVSGRGDLQYEGEIVDYEIDPVAVQGDDQASLNRLTMTVKVRYKNTIEEEKDFEKNFSRFADFEGSESLAEVEEELVEEINDQLTQDIFDASLSDW